jgi:hypothetical protein
MTDREAAKAVWGIISEHLEQFPEDERNRRIDSFIRHVDEITAARAKSSKSPRSVGRKA